MVTMWITIVSVFLHPNQNKSILHLVLEKVLSKCRILDIQLFSWSTLKKLFHHLLFSTFSASESAPCLTAVPLTCLLFPLQLPSRFFSSTLVSISFLGMVVLQTPRWELVVGSHFHPVTSVVCSKINWADTCEYVSGLSIPFHWPAC